MKRVSMVAVGVMVVVSSYATSVLAETPQEVTGSIVFSQQPDGAGKTCVIPVKTGKTNMSDTDCKNDTVSYFQLNNVPSAVVFTLNSEKDCAVSDWYFTMRTIVHPTTTIWLSIPSLKIRQDNEIIVKGLRMERNFYDHGNIEGKLSCVDVVRSEEP